MIGVALKRARLHVADEIEPLMVLPAGFRAVWERQADPFGNVAELLIEGPFPEAVEDGALIGCRLEVVGPSRSVLWTWVDPATGQALSDPALL